MRLILLILFGGLVVTAVPAAAPAGPSPTGVCLVLSGGGARGLAHIGVLRALEERGFVPDCIIGNSAGAIVGSLYCAGFSSAEIEHLLTELDVAELLNDLPDRRRLAYDEKKDPRVLAFRAEFRDGSIHLPRGILSGHKVLTELNLAFIRRGVAHIHDFDRLPVRFRCVAADLKHGRLHVFRNGRLAMAVRASMSIPLVMDPVLLNDMVLVDGMVLNNIPVDVAREMGYEKIIAVNVTGSVPAEKKQLNNFVQILDESLTLARLEKDRRLLEMASVVLQPDVLDYSLAELTQMDDIIAAGHRCASAQAAELTALFTPETMDQRPAPEHRRSYTRPLDSVGVQGASTAGQAAGIRRQSRLQRDEILTEDRLADSLANIYALDWFRFVDMTLLYGDGHARLDFIVEEKPKASVSVSLRYDSDYDILGYGRYVHRNLLDTSHQLSFSVLTGRLDDIRLALETPLPPHRPWQLRAEAYFQSTPHEIQADGRLVEIFEEEHYGVAIGTRLNLGRSAGLHASLHAERLNTMSVGFFDEEDRHAHTFIRFGAGLDTLDKWQFPRRGVAIHVGADKGFRLGGSDVDYFKVKGSGDAYIPLTDRNVLHVNVHAVYGRHIPAWLVEFVGGQNYLSQASFPLPGYDVDELYGKDLWLAGLEWRRHYPVRLPGLVDGGCFFIKYGVAGIRLPGPSPFVQCMDVPMQLFHGGGVGLAMETLVGPVRLFVGVGEQGRYHFSFSLGPDL
ncbi:MAG: patatin-like phospholipase family protein [Acidobacteria bacterium]|nr:patatin-like phospholipase family protein [Acidobacteriota bacterium]